MPFRNREGPRRLPMRTGPWRAMSLPSRAEVFGGVVPYHLEGPKKLVFRIAESSRVEEGYD